MGEGKSMRVAASELHVSVANLSRWALEGVGEIDHLDKVLRSKKKAALPGPPSQLKAIEAALLRFIFEYREQGIAVDLQNRDEGVIHLARVPRKELHGALQRCEALYGCPFVLVSNGNAYVAAPSGRS